MGPSKETADRELEEFRRASGEEGRFLSYCRGRSRHLRSRIWLVVAGFPVVFHLSDFGTAMTAALVVLFGELLDCGLLHRIGQQSELGSRLPLLVGLTTVTAAIQALTLAYLVALVFSLGDGLTTTLAGAVCLAAIMDSAMLFGVHRGSALARLSIYATALAMLALESWFATGEQGPGLLYDLVGAALLTYLIFALARHVQKTRERRTSTQLATLESACQLAHVNAMLEASRDTNRRLAMVAERANDSVVITDPDGRIIWVNRAFSEATGYAFSEAVGQRETMLHGPGTARAVVEDLATSRAECRPVRAEIVHHRKDGTPIWFEVSQAPVFGDTGALTSVVSVERDISEAKRREHALAEARETAERAVEARDSFLATMSHEIRTPMNGVIGTTDLLLETDLDETQRTLVGTINASGEALLAIVNDILDLSKLEAGRLEVDHEPFEPKKVLQAALDIVTPLAESKGVKTGLVVPASLPAWLVGDPRRLRQILLNLLGNAVKFTDAGSVRIVVAVRLIAGICHLEVAIEDTGIGIAPDRIDGIFDRFSQADASIAGRFGGTGLGLSISRLLAQTMGGDIVAESTPGAGSTFRMTLGLAIAEPAATDGCGLRTADPSGIPQFTGLRVLVAEDNRTNTMLLERFLAPCGLDLILAINGREAVDFFRLHCPDVVLMDVRMPVMDGLAATMAIRAIEAESGAARTPIVALTANAFPEDRARCLDAGMDDIVTKPFRRPDLTSAIRRVLVVAAEDQPPCPEPAPPPEVAAQANG